MDTPITSSPRPLTLRDDVERLKAARHVLSCELEQALERFTKQTGLRIYDLRLEALSCVDDQLRYLVTPEIHI